MNSVAERLYQTQKQESFLQYFADDYFMQLANSSN